MINTTTVTITPKKARDILKQNTNNRPLNERHIAFLAKEIEAGNWSLNGESIKIGKTRLIDGQHRLHAIISANKSIKTLVSTGFDDSVFDTIDTGRNRNGADVLHLNGEKYVNNLAALLLLLRKYYDVGFSRKTRVSNVEIEKLLERYPDARDFAGKSPRATGLISPRIIEFCHYVTSKVDKIDSDHFIESLCNGSNLRARSPILAVRNKLMQAKLSNAKFSGDATIIMIIKAWNLFRAGKQTSRITYKQGEKIQRAA